MLTEEITDISTLQAEQARKTYIALSRQIYCL